MVQNDTLRIVLDERHQTQKPTIHNRERKRGRFNTDFFVQQSTTGLIAHLSSHKTGQFIEVLIIGTINGPIELFSIYYGSILGRLQLRNLVIENNFYARFRKGFFKVGTGSVHV